MKAIAANYDDNKQQEQHHNGKELSNPDRSCGELHKLIPIVRQVKFPINNTK